MIWLVILGWLFGLLFLFAWQLECRDRRRENAHHRVNIRMAQDNEKLWRKAAEEVRAESESSYKDTHALVTEPAQACDVCRRLCKPKEDFCHGCGFHVCSDCDDELVITGPHGFDQHVKGPVPRAKHE